MILKTITNASILNLRLKKRKVEAKVEKKTTIGIMNLNEKSLCSPCLVFIKDLLKNPLLESGGLILEKVESTPPNPENEY